eukprot:354244-Chlamydomonas_euryale.AAC.2
MHNLHQLPSGTVAITCVVHVLCQPPLGLLPSPAPLIMSATCSMQRHAAFEACGGGHCFPHTTKKITAVTTPMHHPPCVLAGDGCCPDASCLTLTLLHDEQAMAPVVVPQLARRAASAAGAASPRTPALGPRPHAGWRAVAAPTPPAAAPTPTPADGPLAEWPLRLLQGGDGDGSDGGDSGGVPGARQLLQRAAAQHLDGWPLLEGCPVALPLMGRTFLFEATSTSADAPPGVGAADARAGDDCTSGASGRAVVRPCCVCAATTKITLCFPDDAAAGGGSNGKAPVSSEHEATLAAGAAAAAAAVRGSGSAAAASAARRALAAGFASASSGFDEMVGLRAPACAGSGFRGFRVLFRLLACLCAHLPD